MITEWINDYEFLRNDYKCRVSVQEWDFPSVEHAFQAEKTTDTKLKQKIELATDAREAKKIGRSLPLPSSWDKDRIGIMENLLRQKFSPYHNPELVQKLIGTGDEDLVMDHPSDYFWGTGHDDSGENMLGKLLMHIRKELVLHKVNESAQMVRDAARKIVPPSFKGPTPEHNVHFVPRVKFPDLDSEKRLQIEQSNLNLILTERAAKDFSLIDTPIPGHIGIEKFSGSDLTGPERVAQFEAELFSESKPDVDISSLVDSATKDLDW